MKNQILQRTCLVLTLLLFLAPSVLQAKDKPNVIVVITDDQGMVFTDAHTSSSVCTPTRYGILTGRLRLKIKAEALRIRKNNETIAENVPDTFFSRGK